MIHPPLVFYNTPSEYQTHYEEVYCRRTILTFDGIRVYFHKDQFGHAFYESSGRAGEKDIFSHIRAQRIDWIKATLEHPNATLYAGWMKPTKTYDPRRRVAVIYGDFVVIISLGLGKDGSLKANFKTSYQADNSIGKIKRSPIWTLSDCLEKLHP